MLPPIGCLRFPNLLRLITKMHSKFFLLFFKGFSGLARETVLRFSLLLLMEFFLLLLLFRLARLSLSEPWLHVDGDPG